MADIAGRIGDVLSGYQGLDVKVNGESAEVIVGIGQNGTFEKGGIPLEVGKNVVSVTAKDMLGNSVTKTKTLYRIVPQGPTISAFTGNGQTGIIHTGLPQAVKVKVQYPNGAPVAYKWVDYKVIRSNGLLSTNPVDFSEAKQTIQLRTDEDGEAFAYWRMGSDAGCGNNRIQVTSKDVAGTAYFCASANPRPAEQINIGSGNDQRGAADTNAIDPLRVWVNDTCNGVKDIPVIFTVISGGGKVNGEDETVAVTTLTGHAGVSFQYGPNTGNNVIQATFDGNTGPPATFVLFGAASDSTVPTSFSGVVFDNSNQPIGGVRCQLEIGGEFLPPVLSDLDGSFFIPNVPSGPGSLTTVGLVANTLNGEDILPGSFPALHYQVVIIPNVNNSLGQPVLMPALNPNNAVVFDNSEDVVLTCEGIEGLKMTVKAGSMRLKDGTKPDWQFPAVLSLNQVHHDDIPMPMPDGVAPPFAWTLQPGGATFTTPVTIEYPNMTGLAPGAIAYFLSYDHDLEEFVIVSSGHVSEDGSTIVTDPGSGITKAGWGCNCPPYSVTTDCKNCEYECKSKGRLSGGTVMPTKELVCEGETLSFTASGVIHKGGQLIEKCPDEEDKVIDVTAIPTYEWTITSSVLPAPLKGTGSTASVPNVKAGTYSCSFIAKVVVPSSATVDCVPDQITLPSETARAVKLELVTPKGNPVTAPNDSGDGQNEFTFSNASPGILTVNFKAKVSTGGFDINELKDKVKFTIQNVGKAPTWAPANPGGKATISGGNFVATATFSGLPVKNSDFGKKKVALLCNGSKIEETTIEIFFPKAAKNHPGTGGGTTPNWYFYWAGTAVPGYDITSGTYVYAVGANANDYAQYNGNSANPTYKIHGPASAGHEKYNQAGLNIDRKGIDTLAATLVHEKVHRQVDINNKAGGIWRGKVDQDMDELPDEIEDAMMAQGFDKTKRTTWPMFPYGDDEEVYCEIQAKNTKGVAAKDWANPGKQSKTVF